MASSKQQKKDNIGNDEGKKYNCQCEESFSSVEELNQCGESFSSVEELNDHNHKAH